MTFNPEASSPLSMPVEISDSKARARNSYILEYSWEDCVEAYMRRFPKHPRITVMANSFVLSRQLNDNIERVIRRCLLDIEIPQVLKKALSLTTLSFIQDTLIDHKKRTFRLNTINEFLIGRLEIHENVIMEPWSPEKQAVDHQLGRHCRFYQKATLKLPGLIPFSGQIEKIAMKNYQRNMSKCKYIDTKFILEMLAERRGISLNLSKHKKNLKNSWVLRLIPALLLFLFFLTIQRNLFDIFCMEFILTNIFLLLGLSYLFVNIFNPFAAISPAHSKVQSGSVSSAMMAAALADSSTISPKLLEAPGFRKDIFDRLCKHFKGPSSESNDLSAGLLRLGQLEEASSTIESDKNFFIKVPFSHSLAVYKSRVPPPPPVNHFPPKLLNLLFIKISYGGKNSTNDLWVVKSVRSFVTFWGKVKSIIKKSSVDGLDFLSEFNISNWNYSLIESFDIFLNKDFMISPTKQFQLEYLRVFSDSLLSKLTNDLICVLHESALQKKLTRKLFSFLCSDDGIGTSRPASFDIKPMHLKASHERGSSFPRSLPIAGVVSVSNATRLWREWFFSFAETIPFLFLSTAKEAGKFSIELAIPLGASSVSAHKLENPSLSSLFPGGVYQILYSCKLDMTSSSLSFGVNTDGTICQLVLAFSKKSYSDAWISGFTSVGGIIINNDQKIVPKSPIFDFLCSKSTDEVTTFNRDDQDDKSAVFPPYILGKPYRMHVVINRHKSYYKKFSMLVLDPVTLSSILVNSLIVILGGESQLPNSSIPHEAYEHFSDFPLKTNSDKINANEDSNISFKEQQIRIHKNQFYASLELLQNVDLVPIYNPSGMVSQFSWNSKEKIAFWVNIFYALLLHQKLLSASSISCAYDIGGYIFSATDIRSCLLGNHKYLPNPSASPKVSSPDPRRLFLHLPDDEIIEKLFLILLPPLVISPDVPIVLTTEDYSDDEFITRLHLIASKALEPRLIPGLPSEMASRPLVKIDNSLYPYFKFVEDTFLSYYSSSKWHKRVFFKRLLKSLSTSKIDKLVECSVLKKKEKNNFLSTSKRKSIWRPGSIFSSYFNTDNSTNKPDHGIVNDDEHHPVPAPRVGVGVGMNPNKNDNFNNLPNSPIDNDGEISGTESNHVSEISSFSYELPDISISIPSKLKITFSNLNLGYMSTISLQF